MLDRTFFHIDEYGEFGARALPSVMCISSKTVVWSPSSLLIDKAHANRSGMLTSKQFLELVEESQLVVIARGTWFRKECRNRKGAWDGAAWVTGFDDRLAAIANEDAAERVPANRRVMIAPPEAGWDDARRKLNADAQLASKLRHLLDERKLPLGVLEKAQRASAHGKSAEEQILRDAFNHHHAVIESGCESATVPDASMPTLLALASVERSQHPRAPVTITQSEMREALELLMAIEAPPSYDALKRFLKSSQRSRLVTLLFSERQVGSLADSVVAEIVRAISVNPAFKQFFPDLSVDSLVGNPAGVLEALLALLTSTADVGIVTTPLKLSKGWLQRSGAIALDVDSKSPAAPLLQLALQTKRPNIREVRQLITRLQRL